MWGEGHDHLHDEARVVGEDDADGEQLGEELEQLLLVVGDLGLRQLVLRDREHVRLLLVDERLEQRERGGRILSRKITDKVRCACDAAVGASACVAMGSGVSTEVSQTAQEEIGKLSLDESFSSRERINSALLRDLNEATQQAMEQREKIRKKIIMMKLVKYQSQHVLLKH